MMTFARVWKKYIRWILLILPGILLMVLAVFILLVYQGAWGSLPAKAELARVHNPVATEVYSADGVLMGTFNLQNRQHLDSADIPAFLLEALVATEDARFFEHRGIDYRSLPRVLFKGILLGDRSAGGGSTLSQQLAKNLFPRDDYGHLSMPVNKVKEMVIARRLEKVYRKEEILVLYLSTVPFGENSFGIRAASRRYFNCEPRDLKPEESAVLVGMLKATYSYNPVRFPEHSMQRRNVVLAQMVRYGSLEEKRGDSLAALPLVADYHPLPHFAGIAPYFREFLRKEMEEWCRLREANGKETVNLYTDGLRIHTTIDSRLQAYAEEAMREHMKHLQGLFEQEWKGSNLWRGTSDRSLLERAGIGESDPRSMEVFSWEGNQELMLSPLDSMKYFLGFLQAGFLAMDVQNAEILAWVGGIDHEFFKYDHVLSKRQAGSVFKPLVYLEALEQGMKACDYFSNDSVVYADYDHWTPRNADRSYGGYYSMQGALVHSVNTVAVDLMMRTGIDSVIGRSRLAGIRSPLPAVPSLALGTADVSLMEMVGAYQALANGGIRKDASHIRRIEDRHGRVLEDFAAGRKEILICRPENAALLTGMMEAVVDEGTASALRSVYGLEYGLAGKTGTTQDQSDGWFIGYTPGIVAGAWVGGDLRNVRFRSIRHGQGARSAMPVWALFMQKAQADPRFQSQVADSFRLDPQIRESLSCAHYRERKPFEFKPFNKMREKRKKKREERKFRRSNRRRPS